MSTREVHTARGHAHDSDRGVQALSADVSEAAHNTAHRIYVAAMIASAFLLILSAV